ncbi:hypothetical protein [Natrarchaeobaculum sulfurireducens]|nr:hypothetical protein [Natrarchaeobaculum sulfurireducens]
MGALSTIPTSVDDASRFLPWFRVVFGTIGLLSPRLLGRWYGLSAADGGSLEVALRYACVRALGLGLGQLTASADRRPDWDRIALLVDTLDTLMILEAGLRGRIPRRSALVMLSGTVTGTVVGALTRRRITTESAAD